MSSVQSMVESFFVMFIMVMVGFIILLSVSMQWDIMLPIFQNAGLENVPAEWDATDDRDFLIDLIYGIAYCLFIIGPLQFVITCVRQQDYDQYQQPLR